MRSKHAASLIELIAVFIVVAIVAVIAVVTMRSLGNSVGDEANAGKLKMVTMVERQLFDARGAYSADLSLLAERVEGVEFVSTASSNPKEISVGLVGNGVAMATLTPTGNCLTALLDASWSVREASFAPDAATPCTYGAAQ
jgi:type II secretory pathway pseudopilin PulG